MEKFSKSKILIGLFAAGILIFLIIVGGPSLRLDRFGVSKISWIDCIQLNDQRYTNNNWPPKEIDKSLIDEEIGIITFNIAKKVGNPSYKIRNGDATYLEVGTKIYSIKNEPDKIAAFVDGVYRVYLIDGL